MTESLATGTYDILRNRLRESAADLRSRFERLNAARASVFGNIETKLGATAHVSTNHNCIPRDLLVFGDRLLLGYNVQFGLKTEISTSDVFSLYRFDGDIAHELTLAEIVDERFERDFSELYRYYKNTTFSRFFTKGPYVYFVFQVGKEVSDVKVFKWAIDGTQVRYIDNRSDQEVQFPEQHAFRWTRATRDQHRSGMHPHVSIGDIVFVETVGGDLTIKVEDNTEDGSGIYAEPVENPDQTLDDAEIFYCILGDLVLLRMRPYQEKAFRHLVYSVKRNQVVRLDAIANSCALLPDDHGIIFAGGFFLQNGTYKLFDHGLQELVFERTIVAPNGEDYLYIFTDLETGTYLHLRYNLIGRQVETPLVCHGQAFFDNGQMISFRAQEHAQKHHALQLWQTPYVGPNYKTDVQTDSMLYKIGNRELVRGMAECQELLQLIDKDDSYAELYLDMVKRSTDILDSYFWLDREDAMQLSEPLTDIRNAATAAVDEFDKVIRVRRETEQALSESEGDAQQLISEMGRSSFNAVDDFVGKLAEIRRQRGHVIGLRERRFIDEAAVDALETTLAEAADRLGHRCVQFLLNPKSLEHYQSRIHEAAQKVDSVDSAADGRELEEQLSAIGSDLELLVETVSQLKIDDLTQRTAIVDRTGDLLAELNRVRSSLKAGIRDLLSGEMEADFASQIKLLDQAAAGALETADTPEKVDESLTRMLLQMEELEGRFAEFDELLVRLTEKREALYEAFEARRQHLVEGRSRRCESLASAADRILQGISSRSVRLSDADALHSYFASDPMVEKVRQISEQLVELGDTVRMDDVLSRLKSISDDALRQLRDRNDLYQGDEGQIQLGRHRFSVNRQPLELTSVIRNGRLQVHLTGTQYFQDLSDPVLDASKSLWQQILPSESESVYRAEYLAAELFEAWSAVERREFLKVDETEQCDRVRAEMQQRHDEGYSRGVHDRDAALILKALIEVDQRLGLLRYSASVRGVAQVVWKCMVPEQKRTETERWITGFATVETVLPKSVASKRYTQRIRRLLKRYGSRLIAPQQAGAAAEYLFDQLRSAPPFIVSPKCARTLKHLDEHLTADRRKTLHRTLEENAQVPLAAWTLAMDSVAGYLAEHGVGDQADLDPIQNYREELAAQLMLNTPNSSLGPDVSPGMELPALAGDHPRIKNRNLNFHYHEFLQRLGVYRSEIVPKFIQLKKHKQHLLHQADQKLRTEEFKPKVLTSFVRNQLIDEVYLPLIGDNLAKQIGASGDGKRTDRMGLLLLISPPGYGKTTLMEYVANRLGLVFVKVNGPALGHGVTSLDPEEASNASAREEVQRINVALEMGDNVMLYLDDIQHCNPELLQKFIPLCDATRRIEGVWQGQPRAYDLRGRKVAVVMAGNPYTESGDRFQIPDMLSNRADVYNLGEIIGDSRAAFELSYIENCLTSNSVLQPLAQASNEEQRDVIRAAQRGTTEGLDLQSNIGADNLGDIVSVLSKLLKVRDVILRVNRTYIRSAAQADAYRTEPPFKLQGSYRNMNRIAERVVPIMNDQELESLVATNYEQDAQTLTRDGESNLLKFKELLGTLTPEESERWESIKYAYAESVRMQGIESDDSTAQVLRTLTGLRDGLESIRRTMAQAISANQSDERVQAIQSTVEELSSRLSTLTTEVAGAISDSGKRIEAVNQSLPDQKVLVQHSVPRVMTDLVESQFQLLYDGLRPVLEASALTNTQLEGLRKSIDDCLDGYRELRTEIDLAQETEPQSGE